MTKTLKNYGYYLILGLILVCGIFLRLKWLIANPSFWDDECSLAWNVVNKNYPDFFSVLNFTQVAPPFFMVMTKFLTKIFGTSDFTLRISPFIFGISSIIVFLVITLKLFDKKITIIASNLVFATNQALINYSSEFKQYSCDVFFTLLCFYLFADMLANKFSYKKIAIYSVTFAISIWFSFVSAFTIAAGVIVLIIKQIKEKSFNLKKAFLLFLPIIISCLLYLKIYIFKTFSANISGLNDYWSNSYILKDFSNFFALAIKNLRYFLFPSNIILPAILAIIVGLYVILKKRYYLGLILILTFLFECLASWLQFYPFEKRVVLFLIPTTLIFISAIWELFNPKEKIKSCCIAVLFISIFIQTFFYTYAYIKTPKPTRGYYPREMMSVMLQKIRPDDIIVISKYSRTDFAYYSYYYYKIKNKTILEGWNDDRNNFLGTLKPHKYYWFYMPFGPSPTFDKWFSDKKREILFQMDGNGMPSKLVYVHAK